MGVPKFYRWISERYPKINQFVSDSTLLPEFDNLYLDMNGILHTCTHPNDDGLSAQLSERDIILGVFHYIDRIVTHIVRPKKVLFMAIDGVAPRAKMNQQRSRRFRARKDMKEAKLIAESKGEVVDDEAVFDSNCITPGTEFMAKISRHLRYFIQKKITEDPLWKALTVTFSGHEVPGEGEHKIMAYIRDERSAGRLPSNTRHCMYGQDADLILLGLATHEPHFTLLREVVNFGQNASKGNATKVVVKTTRDAQFQLLHLSVLREYIWAEFTRDMPEATEAEMDRERVLDDFVFLTFLVGNDFLPHMPSLDIGEEAFSLLFQIYRSLKPAWGGTAYLTCEGEIADPDRLEQFLAEVGAREDDIFSDRAEEEAEFRGRRRKSSRRFGRAEDMPSEAEIALQEERLQETYENAMLETLGYIPETDTGGKDYKGRYYYEKFGITPIHGEIHNRLRAAYVEGLMWCLAYYYKGCISWNWFFPFHYVPMISDLTDLRQMMDDVRFELSKPFLPFEQLLGCLPGASAGFLPAPYARLMTSPDSPIIDFYPEDFEIDMNGKRNPWEAVNILPFIDSFRLRAAVQEHCPRSSLTPEEVERNTMGQVMEYYHDATVSRLEPSCNPEIGLPDIPQCSAISRVGAFSIEPGECFKPELPADAVIPTAGFPSLHVLPLGSVEERKVPVNVFGTASRYATLVLHLKRPSVLPPALALASKVLGRSAFLNWPLMHEARVMAISDEKEEYRLKEARGKRKTDVRVFAKDEADRWRMRAAEEQGHYLTGRGVPGSGGVDIGKVQLMLKARPLQGMRVDPATGARRKVFGTGEAEVPVHMVLWSCPSEDPRFLEKESATLQERFPLGSRVICLHGGSGHGCGGDVSAYDGHKVDVRVDLRPPEPPFGLAIVNSIRTQYFPQHRACESLGIKPQVFGRVVGSINVDPGKLDLGLNLKQNGRYQLLGYTRCVLRREAAWSTSDTVKVVGSAPEAEDAEASSWEFSAEALRLVARYARTFPQLFHGLGRRGGDRFFDANTLLGQGGQVKAEEISRWLSDLETSGLQRVPVTTKALSREAVKAVERGADVRQAVLLKNGMLKKTVITGLEPSQLVPYEAAGHTDAPMDTGGEKPDLGDRVVNMRAKGVPFGLWGTVVANHSHSACVEVVFDEEFIGGSTLHGMCSNYRGALVPWATVAKIHTQARLQALRSSAAAKQGAGVSATAGRDRKKAPAQASILRRADSAKADSRKRLEARATPSTTNASAAAKIAGLDALKGALGIRPASTAASPTTHVAETTSDKVPVGSTAPNRTARAATAASSSTGHAMSNVSVGASAMLKGMLGVGVPDGTMPAGGASSIRGTGRQDGHGGGVDARSAALPFSRAVSVDGSSKAAAELKALIGVGTMQSSAPDAGAAQPSTASTAARGAVGSTRDPSSTVVAEHAAGTAAAKPEERALTPPPPPASAIPAGAARNASATHSRKGRMLPLVMSPEAAERRGQSQFRQAKGPDKTGIGFKIARGSSLVRAGRGSDGGRGFVSASTASVSHAHEGASTGAETIASATLAAAAEAAAKKVSSAASAAGEDSSKPTAASVASGAVPGMTGEKAEGERRNDASARLRIVKAQEKAHAEASTCHKTAAAGGASERMHLGTKAPVSAEAATAAAPMSESSTAEGAYMQFALTYPQIAAELASPTPHAAALPHIFPSAKASSEAQPVSAATSKKEQLMSMIGAGRPPPQQSPPERPLQPHAPRVGFDVGTAGTSAGAVNPTGAVEGGRVTGGPSATEEARPSALSRAPSPPPPQPPSSSQPLVQAYSQQHMVHQQAAVGPRAAMFGHPGFPHAFVRPGGMLVAPAPPPHFAPGPEGDAQRVLWQQQRMLEAAQLQQRHHLLLQQQHVHALGFGQVSSFPGGLLPTGAFLPPHPYSQYAHPQAPMTAHPQMLGAYAQAPRQFASATAPDAVAAVAHSAAVPTPAPASNVIPRKSRRTQAHSESKKADVEGASGAPLMIPSSALLAGSRRSLRADRRGGKAADSGGATASGSDPSESTNDQAGEGRSGDVGGDASTREDA